MPELAPWSKDARLPDITIRLSPLPERLGRAQDISPVVQLTAEGAALVTIQGVATYLLTGASDILVNPILDGDRPEVKETVLGTVFGLLCLGRGLFPVQGTAIGIDGRAVLLTGPAGCGKSTLAAALIRRGHALLSDDISVIDGGNSGIPRAWPTFSRIKLWQDGSSPKDAEALDWAEDRRSGYDFHGTAAVHSAPLPLYAVYDIAAAASVGLTPLDGDDRLAALDRAIYRRRAADAWGLTSRLLGAAARITEAAQICRLTHGGLGAAMEDMIRAIETHAAR